MTFARLRDRSIAFEDTGGDGAPIVLLHAAAGSAAMWERQLSAFRDAGHRCVAFDRHPIDNAAKSFASIGVRTVLRQ